jgi:hypothetical protein
MGLDDDGSLVHLADPLVAQVDVRFVGVDPNHLEAVATG